MPDADGRPAELLVLSTDSARVDGMSASLREAGITVDIAGDLTEGRARFLACGGHDALLLSPEVAPGLAIEAVLRLRELDTDLAVITFGEEQLRDRDVPRVTRLSAYHPASRAGVGAILKLLIVRSPR